MLPVLSKIDCIFEYIYDERGRPTGQTKDILTINPTHFITTAKFGGRTKKKRNIDIILIYTLNLKINVLKLIANTHLKKKRKNYYANNKQ